MEENCIFSIAILIETLALVILAFRANKLRTTAGLSTFWSGFIITSSIFSLFSRDNSLLFIILCIAKGCTAAFIIVLQLSKFPLSSAKYKESKFSIGCSVFSVILLILVFAKKITPKDLALFLDAFAITSQSLMTKSSQKITALSWITSIMLTLGNILRFIGGMIVAFKTEDFSMWCNAIGAVFCLLNTIDFLFFFISVFLRNNEPGLPL